MPVNNDQNAPRALLTLEKDGRDRRTDGRQTDALRFPLDCSVTIDYCDVTSPYV